MKKFSLPTIRLRAVRLGVHTAEVADLSQTLSPINTRADGTPKTQDDAMAELRAAASAFAHNRPLPAHVKCVIVNREALRADVTGQAPTAIVVDE